MIQSSERQRTDVRRPARTGEGKSILPGCPGPRHAFQHRCTTTSATSDPARGFLGLSASQRFVLALLLLLAVCVLGTMCLLITGRISTF